MLALVLRWLGTNDRLLESIASTALKIALVLSLFGEIARYKEAWERKNNPSGKPTRSKALQQDCTITMAGSLMEDLKNGKVNPMMAVMSGKLKIKGDQGLAMKLQAFM